MVVRLDKFLVEAGVATRSEATKLARAGLVLVNGKAERRCASHIDPTVDTVTVKGQEVIYREFTYVMLNKPEGYVSATEDEKLPTVLELLPEELQRIGLFPCGRLDRNTLGLMILTNNGPLSHKILAPKSHVSKVYYFKAEDNITDEDVERLQSGVDIGGYVTAPCEVELVNSKEGYITLHEGKYHQIKLMLKAVCNKIIYLERVKFGPVALDTTLQRGEWRYLTDEEQKALEEAGKIRV